ncbi:MAG: low molecular weight phosphotyrosine protein phosphatase [Saprospiraceae bacterium]|nr:low molecular weight phosphotyrosine protein phosphatase [Saprospiraceae bacterium]
MNTSILIVCKGNICRSPIAEGLLRKKAALSGKSVYIDSAGTGHWHIGKAPDPRAIDVAQKNDVDIQDLRARQVEYADLDRFDQIYTMDEDNLSRVRAMAVTERQFKKIQPLSSVVSSNESEVVDPYKGGQKDFESVFTYLDTLTTALISTLT